MVYFPFFSIIIPVYNGGPQFERCLGAIKGCDFVDYELIVVDDGSTDGSGALAVQYGARLLSTPQPQSGPALARNIGAEMAVGDYLFFTDADCVVHGDTLVKAANVLRAEPKLDALFGSYDDEPGAGNFMAQYKNLFHHYVHQQGNREAGTFWTGCGIIKRARFLALGGFDTVVYSRPSIEDIDLGYRLKEAGGRIWLVKDVQVKHLKAWTFWGVLRSDILDRGIPWTELILRAKVFNNDLNLQTHNRVSVVAVYSLLMALLVALFELRALGIAVGLAIVLLWLNYPLYWFFYKKRGLFFVLRVVPVHWLYYVYNAVAFGVGVLKSVVDD